MGYSTDFTGKLGFKGEPSISDLKFIKAVLGQDAREHSEWKEHLPDGVQLRDVGYMDLDLCDDFSGIEWSGAEKTRGLEHSVSILIGEARKSNPDFGLIGELQAQGEDVRDRWILRISDEGKGVKVECEDARTWIECPDCGHEFEAPTPRKGTPEDG